MPVFHFPSFPFHQQAVAGEKNSPNFSTLNLAHSRRQWPAKKNAKRTDASGKTEQNTGGGGTA
jgi:hypothetical protein